MAQQTIIVQQPPVNQAPTGALVVQKQDKLDNYSTGQSLGLGIAQIVIGILCNLFNIGAIVLDSHLATAGHGFWSGAFFIMAGSFGISASKCKSSCNVNAFMGLSIFNAFLCLPLLIISAVGVDHDNGSEYCYFGFCTTTRFSAAPEVIAMNGMLVFLSLLECIVAIWSSAVCCRATCCGGARYKNKRLGGTQVNAVQVSHPQTVQYVGQPQTVQYGGQPQTVQHGGQPQTVQYGGQPQTVQYAQHQQMMMIGGRMVPVTVKQTVAAQPQPAPVHQPQPAPVHQPQPAPVHQTQLTPAQQGAPGAQQLYPPPPAGYQAPPSYTEADKY